MTEIEQQQITDPDYYVKVDKLVTRFFTSKGIVKALDGVSFGISSGEVYGLVGESGCGKSVTATSIMDLIPDPPGRIISGSINIDNFNILGDLDKLVKINVKSETDVKVKRNKHAIKRHNLVLSGIRGKKLAMIFQEPFLALNPVITIGNQIIESILLHNRVEIANSIIRRETIKPEDVSALVDELTPLDLDERRIRINRWVQSYGVTVLEPTINDLFNSTGDVDYVKKELINLIMSEKGNQDLSQIVLARDYFKHREQLLELHMNLMEAERKGNLTEISNLQNSIANFEADMKSQFSSYTLRRRLFKKRMDKPFVAEARRRTLELLKLVNIAGAERVIDSYPHELSGGMQQRAMIAMALSSNPKLLIADEPTTALDVTTQAQILDLIKDLNSVVGSSVLFITHDLAVVAEMCNRVGVMYAGNLVEEAAVGEIFKKPKHPYTIGLMKSVPRADKQYERGFKLESIPGNVPNLITPPTGCRFHPRCEFAMDVCSQKKPKLVDLGESHKVACFLYSNETEEVAQ